MGSAESESESKGGSRSEHPYEDVATQSVTTGYVCTLSNDDKMSGEQAAKGEGHTGSPSLQQVSIGT